MLEKGRPHPAGYRFTPPLPAQVNPHKPACVMENIRDPRHVSNRKHRLRFSFPPLPSKTSSF